jgi:hypothetical protein
MPFPETNNSIRLLHAANHMLGMHLDFHDLAADYACRFALFDRDLNLTWLVSDHCWYGYRQLDRFLGLHFLAL